MTTASERFLYSFAKLFNRSFLLFEAICRSLALCIKLLFMLILLKANICGTSFPEFRRFKSIW